jgi:hypothetical protein
VVATDAARDCRAGDRARVIAADINDHRLERSAAAGATRVINRSGRKSARRSWR